MGGQQEMQEQGPAPPTPAGGGPRVFEDWEGNEVRVLSPSPTNSPPAHQRLPIPPPHSPNVLYWWLLLPLVGARCVCARV